MTIKSLECPKGLPETEGMCANCPQRKSCLELFDTSNGLTGDINKVLQRQDIEARQLILGAVGTRPDLTDCR